MKLFLFFLYFILTHSLYFLIHSNKKKCFYIEQPTSTPITYNYNILDKNDELLFEIFVGTIINIESRIKHQNIQFKGIIEQITELDGFYTICFSQIGNIDRPTRLQFSIDYGYDDKYYEKLAKDQNFEPMNLEIRKLNDEMNLILSEADYKKHKEVEFHTETEAMNDAALWFPMVQIGILLAAGIFQVRHLKFFFKANKSM